MIKIIVDSTCDLSEAFIEKYQIDIVPLQVIINDNNYKDKFELDINQLYEHIRQKDDIKTSLPSYDDIFPIFEKYAKANQPFIFFSFSKALSGTFNFANLLIKDLKDTYNTQMRVVDFKNGGLASAVMMEEIVAFMETNDNIDDIVNFSENLVNRMHHAVMLEDLSQLRKGGRISAVKSIISSALSIKHILELVDGHIVSYKNAIGSKRALNDLMHYVTSKAPDKETKIGVLYSANEDLLNQMLTRLDKHGYKNFVVGRIASVMTAHIGLDAVSVCFLSN